MELEELKRTEPFLTRSRINASRFGKRGYFCKADALAFLKSIKSEVADIVFLDPPFNLGKDYGVHSIIEAATKDVYEAYLRSILAESERVLKSGGALYLYHLPYWASKISHSLSALCFRHWIAISMKNGFVRGNRLYPAHYALLYYTKGEPSNFKRPKLKPMACRHCGGLVKNYGGYTSIIKKKGINLSDFWEDTSPVRHANKKLRQANQLPQLITDRIVAISGVKGGVIVDPFVGTGTSLVSALSKGMVFIANDLSSRNIKICKERITTNLE